MWKVGIDFQAIPARDLKIMHSPRRSFINCIATLAPEIMRLLSNFHGVVMIQNVDDILSF